MRRKLGAAMSTAESALEKSPAQSVAGYKPTLQALANFLTLNHLEVEPESIALLAKILLRFDPVEARAALTSAVRQTGKLLADRVLWFLADRCWKEQGLPPPSDQFIEAVWAKVWGGGRAWHPAERLVVDRYGWQNISGQEYEKAGVITAQLRQMYEAERARVVDHWIAEVSLAAERDV